VLCEVGSACGTHRSEPRDIKKTAKKLTAANAELTKTLTVVRAQLTKAETKLGKANERARRWKGEAAAARTAASRSDARVELQIELDPASLEPVHAVGPLGGGRLGSSGGRAHGPTVPDQAWTVVQLRAEARARGLAGMSNKPKVQHLSALTRDA